MHTVDIEKVHALLEAYKSGRLGGEKMPEDENPALDKSSKENYFYLSERRPPLLQVGDVTY